MPLMAKSPNRRGGAWLDVLQDEEGDDGDEHDHPRPGEPCQQCRRGPLRVADDLSHGRLHQPVDLTDRRPLPPRAGEETHDDLTALNLCGHLRELLRQTLDLGRQAWAYRHPGTAERREDHQVHEHDRHRSALYQPPLREPDEGEQEVREEQRKGDDEEPPRIA